MKQNTINLEHLAILIADKSEPSRKVIQTMLHAFGANEVLHASTGDEVMEKMTRMTVDLLICDIALDDDRGPELVRRIRHTRDLAARFIPIMMTCGHTRLRDIVRSRDSGANIVVKKPLSVQVLYDRMCWIAHKPRPFVDVESYTGPCRRFRNEGFPNGIGRRAADKEVMIGDDEAENEASGVTMTQEEIDNAFADNV